MLYCDLNPPQILIELETALLDDEPHWYKLQTHDVSSMPLPRASPNTQRRQLHGESPTRRLQSTLPPVNHAVCHTPLKKCVSKGYLNFTFNKPNSTPS